MELNEILKTYRKRAGVTQDQISKATGLSKTYISTLERGVHKCNAETLIAYAKLCHVSLDEMVGLSDSYNPDDFINIFSSLSVEEQEKLLRIMRIMKE